MKKIEISNHTNYCLMKKIVIVAVFFTLSALAMQAQDTVYSDHIPEKYYHDFDWWNEYDSIFARSGWSTTSNCAEATLAKIFTTKDSMKVYGLAASVYPEAFIRPSLGNLDTVPDEIKEQVFVNMRLYGCGTETPFGMPYQVGPDLVLRYNHPSYYFFLTKPQQSVNPMRAIPVYEQYFDQPITVTDTFFIGVTQNPTLFYPNLFDENMFCMYVNHYVRTNEYILKPGENVMFANVSIDSCGWIRGYESRDIDIFLYPIITPNPDDTTGGGNNTGDTVGIGSVSHGDLMSRYVSVQPNPAADEATVLSSFGLTRIEAYDPNGHCIADLPASGLQAILNVHSWPAATYLLRITTPVGTVTKKLIVR